MVKYRNIRVKMRGGGSRIQRAMVLASGKLRFVSNKVRHRSSKVQNRTTKKHGSVKNLKRRKGRFARRGFTLPLAPTAGAIATVLGPAPYSGRSIIQNIQEGNWKQLAMDGQDKFTGVDQDGKFHLDWIAGTYGPVAAGLFVHWLVGNKLGANRVLGRARVPLIRI